MIRLLPILLLLLVGCQERPINIILPADGSEVKVDKDDIVKISVNEKGQILIDDKSVLLPNVKALIQEKIKGNPKVIFSVATHKRAKYQDYINLLDELKKANATKISIVNPN